MSQFNFTLLFNTNLTSTPTAASQFSEALLFVDEPASPQRRNRVYIDTTTLTNGVHAIGRLGRDSVGNGWASRVGSSRCRISGRAATSK